MQIEDRMEGKNSIPKLGHRLRANVLTIDIFRSRAAMLHHNLNRWTTQMQQASLVYHASPLLSSNLGRSFLPSLPSYSTRHQRLI